MIAFLIVFAVLVFAVAALLTLPKTIVTIVVALPVVLAKAATSWWHYRYVCLPVSVICLLFFGLSVFFAPPALSFLLIFLPQFIIGTTAWYFYKLKVES